MAWVQAYSPIQSLHDHRHLREVAYTPIAVAEVSEAEKGSGTWGIHPLKWIIYCLGERCDAVSAAAGRGSDHHGPHYHLKHGLHCIAYWMGNQLASTRNMY